MPKLSLLLISDIHGNINAVKKLVKARNNQRDSFDALIISGDFPATVPFSLVVQYIIKNQNLSRINYSRQVYFEELRSKFVAAQIESINKMIPLLKMFGMPICYIPGNVETRELMHYVELKYPEIHLIEKKPLKLNNTYCITGLGGSLDHLGVICDYEYSIIEFNKRVENFENHLTHSEGLSTIFVFHESPKFTREKLEYLEMIKKAKKRGYRYNFPYAAGSSKLYDIINKYKPKLVLNGHYHEYRGLSYINSIPVVNPGPLATYHYAITNFQSNRNPTTKFFQIRSNPLSFINFLYQSRQYQYVITAKHY